MKLSLPSPFSLVLTTKILFFLIAAITPEAVDDFHYSNCSKPHSCGSIPEIKYPFWGSNSRPSYCGLQHYEIICEGNVPLFHMKSQPYVVGNIERSPYTMRIKPHRLDNICPSNFVDSIDFNLVNYSSSSENLTLFNSCPPDVLDNVKPKEKFECGDNDSVIAPLEETVLYKAHQRCEHNVTIWVMKDEWKGFSNGNLELIELMEEGFEVEYETQVKMQKCQSCEKSGGLCGTNITYQFTCFCKDGPRNFSCPCVPSS